jgi:hypothetical protein
MARLYSLHQHLFYNSFLSRTQNFFIAFLSSWTGLLDGAGDSDGLDSSIARRVQNCLHLELFLLMSHCMYKENKPSF